MKYKNLSQINLEFSNHCLTLSLNRSDASNAFSTVMIEELISTLTMADEDNDVRVIVITGEGKHFCAGGDVKDMQNKTGMFAGEPNELRERYKRGIQKIPLCFQNLSTPVIAKVNGAAIGAGLDLACMCDIRYAYKKAKFGETFVKLGLIPGDGGTYFLQRIVGYAKAMELTLTGDIIDSSEALKIGLISDVFDSLEELNTKVDNVVNVICSNSSIACQMAKRSLNHAYRNDLNSTLDLLAAYQGITQRTSDHFALLDGVFGKSQETLKHS